MAGEDGNRFVETMTTSGHSHVQLEDLALQKGEGRFRPYHSFTNDGSFRTTLGGQLSVGPAGAEAARSLVEASASSRRSHRHRGARRQDLPGFGSADQLRSRLSSCAAILAEPVRNRSSAQSKNPRDGRGSRSAPRRRSRTAHGLTARRRKDASLSSA